MSEYQARYTMRDSTGHNSIFNQGFLTQSLYSQNPDLADDSSVSKTRVETATMIKFNNPSIQSLDPNKRDMAVDTA